MKSPIFVEVAAEVGLDFQHFNGMSGEYYFPEMMGAGGALFDYDDDGDLDLYLVQGTWLGARAAAESDSQTAATDQEPADLDLIDRLYRNDLEVAEDGSRLLRFTDVTRESGLQVSGYGMGAATGDFDRDGWVDLYITNYGSNNLLRNNGDGTFSDVTATSGADDSRWSVPALFVDYDRDGWLDLFIGNYVESSISTHRRCFSQIGTRDYCGPLSFKPVPDRLLRNRGDGRFEDVTGRAGLGRQFGGALGAAMADFNLDGWPDLYVGNDGLPNQLWMNQADGTFRNEALLAGCAVNEEGNPEASMGVAVADFDLDGDEDLFMTHLDGETSTLYVNDGQGLFDDFSVESGLAVPSLARTGFGTAWIDFDQDQKLDLLVVNGAVKIIAEQALRGDPLPLRQPNQLFHALEGGGFEEVTAGAGAALQTAEVSRAALFGDVDNDGDVDVVITNNNGPARLLLNQLDPASSWLGLRLVSASGRPDLLGAWVGMVMEPGPTLWRRVRTDGSYAGAGDPRVLIGLTEGRPPLEVRVLWPDGEAERWSAGSYTPGVYNALRQGTGEPLENLRD